MHSRAAIITIGLAVIGPASAAGAAPHSYLALTGGAITKHRERWAGQTLGAAVFAMPDTMAARQALHRKVSLMPGGIQLVIETRMAAREGFVYTYHPHDPAGLAWYADTLADDDDVADVDVTACGTRITVGVTAEAIVAYAVWQFIRWTQELETTKEIILGVAEPGIHTEVRS